MEYWLTAGPVPGMVLWIILYVSDYYLTLYSARGFNEIGHFHHEGSFELTPQYQKDIDSQTKLSKRHILLLVIFTIVIYLLWLLWSSVLHLKELYSLYLGMFLLLEVAVHFRHLRNIHLIRTVKRDGGVVGDITYRKHFSYKISAFELYLFSALYFIVACLSFSLFFLGGSIMCMGTGIKHNNSAKKALKLDNPQPIGENGNPV